MLISSGCKAQKEAGKKLTPPSEFFKNNNPKVLVVGAFHFDYPNLDAVKTENSDQIDILSKQKQLELKELIDYIKLFKPTKIGVESYSNQNFTQELVKYQKGEIKLSRDERHQIGVRIANELNIDTIYSLDAISLYDEIKDDIPHVIDSLMVDFDFSNEENDLLFKEWFAYDRSLPKSISLLEYFKYSNSKEYHKYLNGYYYVGDFKNSQYSGADITTIYWFSRNLRILRRIQDIIENQNDRILVIFGNSHAAALRTAIIDSPTLDYIEFDSLNKDQNR